MRRRPAAILVGLLGLGVVALIAVEFGMGAIGFGQADLADPCTSTPHLSEGGFFGAIDRRVQEFALAGVSGAACSLHTSREELVLSFSPSLKTKKVRWTKSTIRKALRGGFDRAAHEATKSLPGLVGDAVAFVLREGIADPLAYLLGEVAT